MNRAAAESSFVFKARPIDVPAAMLKVSGDPLKLNFTAVAVRLVITTPILPLPKLDAEPPSVGFRTIVGSSFAEDVAGASFFDEAGSFCTAPSRYFLTP